MSIVAPVDGYFPITSVHRADLEGKGFDVSKVTDCQMEQLANKMGDSYLEFGGFWECLEEYATGLGIPRIEGIDKHGYCTKCGCHVSTHNDDGSCVDDKKEEEERDEWPKHRDPVDNG